ncbi:MAG: PorT family protein [Treponema sp.]|nr:PorT family protein [Treponema sp.]
MKRTLLLLLMLLEISCIYANESTASNDVDDILAKFSGGGEFALGINTPLSPAPNGKEFQVGVFPTCHFGLGVEYHCTDTIALQCKALFHFAGLSYTDDDTIKTKLLTIDIPLLFKYTLTPANSNSNGKLAVVAGPTFAFDIKELFPEQKNDDTFNNTSDKDNNTLDSGPLRAIGIQVGIEYAFKKTEGLRIGCSALFDFVNFKDGSHLCTRRACIMPSIGYWL